MTVERNTSTHYRGKSLDAMSRTALIRALMAEWAAREALEAKMIATPAQRLRGANDYLWYALFLIAAAAFGGYLWGIAQCP